MVLADLPASAGMAWTRAVARLISLWSQTLQALGRRGCIALIAAASTSIACCTVSLVELGVALARPDSSQQRDLGSAIRALELSHRELMRTVVALHTGLVVAPEGERPAVDAFQRFEIHLEGVCRDAAILSVYSADLAPFCHRRLPALGKLAADVAAFDPPSHTLSRAALQDFNTLRDELSELSTLVGRRNDQQAARLAAEIRRSTFVLALSTGGFAVSSLVLFIMVARMLVVQSGQAAKVRHSAELLGETLEALSAGVVVYDPQGRLLMFNSAARQVTPALQPESIGRTYAELAGATAQQLEAAGRGRPPVEEWIARFNERSSHRTRQALDGRWIDWSEKSTPGGLTVGLRVDVTEIKTKELELEREREKYQLLIGSLTDTVYVIDLRGTVTYISPAVSALLGVSAEKVVGTPFSRWVAPEDVDRALEEGHAYARTPNREMRQIRIRMRAVDGTIRHVEVRYRRALGNVEVTSQVGVIRDITERVELERMLDDKLAELARARAEYQSLVDSLSDVVYKIDSQTATITFVSAAATDMLGWPVDEIVGRSCLDLIDPEFHATIAEQGSRPFSTDEPAIMTRFRVRAANGELRHVEARARRRRDEQGKLISVGVMRDIEDRVALERRVEEQVRALEQVRRDYRSLVDSLSDVAYTLDVETGKYTFISAAGEKFFGKPACEIIGRHFLDFVAPQSREWVERVTTRRYRPDDPGTQSSFCVIGAGGEIRTVEVRARRHLDEDGRLLSTGIIRDIEDRVQLERRLDLERSRLRSIVESSGALIVVVDASLRIVMANGGFETLSGAAADSAIGLPLKEIVDCPLDAAIAKSSRFAAKMSDRSGRERLVNFTATPVVGAGGLLESWVLIGVDDTERRDAEQALFDAERFATVGEMAGTMAHEISQPLQVINIACASAHDELMAAEDGAMVDREYVGKKLERIAQQVDAASRIVDDLRAFVRGSGDDQPGGFDPGTAIVSAADLTAHGVRQAGASLNLEIASDLPHVVGDVGRLEQVLVNLINNARDAGGRTIDVIAAPVGAAIGPAYVRIRVEDSGHGIDEKILDRLFVSFVTTKPRGKGTGLGLRICRRIIEEMGGTITAANRPEGGARLEILLPVAPALQPSQSALALRAS